MVIVCKQRTQAGIFFDVQSVSYEYLIIVYKHEFYVGMPGFQTVPETNDPQSSDEDTGCEPYVV